MNTPARRNHKSPRNWKSYALGAAAAAALLATTACEPGAAEGSDSSKSSAQPSATASAKPGGASGSKDGDGAGSGAGTAGTGGSSAESSGSTAGSGGSKGSGGGTSSAGATSGGGTGSSGGTAGGGAGTGGGGKETIAACSQTELGVSAVKERDARHLVLTVQNAGTKKCNLYRYPLVRLGDGRTTAPVIKESDATPGVPVTLAPGQEGYAALLVSGPMDEYEAESITLSLQGSKPGSSAGKPIDVPMPVDTLYANDFQRVTYWTTASGYALDFIMSK
ncbi:DUF4232 domain-containing protein [Streptomyces sp. NBC_00568]|uniref:DUF4232 domain-containing protein n=1 Tax=Streptomyces sp. NBC_00568 TaxID=2975779 RepID=UPI00224CAC73|nr:DUF4232 domain-containing protein [Streptomyces sp. NBC_00568]MCX4990269.1 DUF4232 domain-containing protein [Streptomyces sp. NBC_00568]